VTVISTQNSSKSSLTSNATYVGAGESASGYSTVTITLRGNAVGAGTLYVGFSADNSSWTETAFTVSDPTTQAPIMVRVDSLFYRIRYVNGATAQSSFRIQSAFLVNPTAGSTGPVGPPGPQGPEGPAGPGAVSEIKELITISAEDQSSKSFALSQTPTTPANLNLFPLGAPKQIYGIDFTVSGATVSWNGMGLDGFLLEGEQVEVRYFV